MQRLFLLLVLVFLVACGGSAPSRLGQRVSDAVLGLCETARLAAHDPVAARAVFFNSAHATLHELAAEVEQRDRRASAQLLMAKQRVESDLTGPSEVLALLDSTRAAAAVIDITTPPCPG